eukprot:g57481.t1
MASSNSSEAKSAQRKSHRLNEKKQKKAARSSEEAASRPSDDLEEEEGNGDGEKQPDQDQQADELLARLENLGPNQGDGGQDDGAAATGRDGKLLRDLNMRNLRDLGDSENSSSSLPSSGGRRRQGKRGKEIYSDREALATVEDARSYIGDLRGYVMLMAKKGNVWSKRNHAEMRDWGTIIELMRKRVGFSNSEAYRFAARRFVALAAFQDNKTIDIITGPPIEECLLDRRKVSLLYRELNQRHRFADRVDTWRRKKTNTSKKFNNNNNTTKRNAATYKSAGAGDGAALNVLLVPSFFPSSSWLALRKPVTAEHLRIHGFLLRVSRDFVSAATSDMSFFSFPSYLSVFSTSSNSLLFNVSPTPAYYYGGGSYCVPPVTAPDPAELVADRVRFPSRGAFVDLLAGLTSDVASMYGTPARVLNLDHPVFTGSASLPYAKFPAYVGGLRHQYLRLCSSYLGQVWSLYYLPHMYLRSTVSLRCRAPMDSFASSWMPGTPTSCFYLPWILTSLGPTALLSLTYDHLMRSGLLRQTSLTFTTASCSGVDAAVYGSAVGLYRRAHINALEMYASSAAIRSCGSSNQMISSRRPIVGIDIGNDTSLVCIAREGKLTVLTNSSGKHKTATVVAFTDSGRQIGDEAVGGRSQNYARTFTYFKRLIGVLPDLAPKVLQQEEPFAYYPIQLEGNGLCLPVTVRDETHLIRPASLMTSMLRDLKQTAEREMDGQEVDECVLSCPPSWNHVQRKELLDAATSAGLSVLRLLHDTTAVALNFGFFRTFKEPTLTCFLDMGAANFTASLVKFSEDALTVNGTISAAIGGRDFDTLMISNLAKELKTRKPPIDLAENKKARLKVLREVTRLKETLSANQHASTVVENLANDQDVKLSFNREEFERLCEPMLAKMEVVLSQLLEQTKVTKADIKDVEVVGGGLRIPCVQARLAKFFGKELAKHCDSNESVVRGCTLQCAILSRSMNTKELKIQDCAPFPVRICWMQQDDTEKALVLFKKFGKCPFQADVAISNAKLDAQGKVVVELRYADEETQAEAGKAPLLRAIVVPRSAGEKFKLRVKLNDHGLPEFKMAYVKETTEVEKDGKTKKTSKNVQLQMEVEVLGGLSAQEWKNSQCFSVNG